MEPAPSTTLREFFASLAGGSPDPTAALAAAGHGDLPGDLVAEAIVNYADTAPVEVAEHLSPFVMSHSAVPQPEEDAPGAPDTGDGLSLLATAPSVPEPGPESGADHDTTDDAPDDATSVMDAGADGPVTAPSDDHPGDHPADHGSDPAADLGADHPAPDDLFFGTGEPGPTLDAALDPAPDGTAADVVPLHDPVSLDAPAQDGGWLDVTSGDIGDDLPAGLDQPLDVGHDTDPALSVDEPHDGSDGLDAGAGA